MLNDSIKSGDKWEEDLNTNMINDYDILTSTLNTMAIKDASTINYQEEGCL